MGYACAGRIEKAVRFLLPILQAEKWVTYSRFYDGTDECHRRLCASLGEDPDCSEAEVLMDLAVDQLLELGVVRRLDLDEKLLDGENDYRVELVEGKPDGPIRVRDRDL